jgi:chemotaxis protein methyltransferase CheR
MILEEQKDADGAERMFKKALYVDNDYVLAHFALGNLSMRLGKHTESKKHLRNTMELLSRHKTDETLPESEGITAGRLTEMLRSTNP